MGNRTIYPVIFLAVFLLMVITPAAAMASEPPAGTPESYEEPALTGTAEGSGTYFEVTDSEYYNVALESSQPVNIILESIPSVVALNIETAGGALSAQMTIYGLAPLTTYYKYEDSYANKEEVTTDESGGFTWTQDLSRPHQVWFQEDPSTRFISDDATGGDCVSIGDWDPASKTCTLTADVYETIEIMADNVTLDGAGYTVQGAGAGNGVFMNGRSGVTVRNINAVNFTHGIYFISSYNITVAGCTASSNSSYGIFSFKSSGNMISGSTASNNRYGIILQSSSSSDLTGNTTASNKFDGIFLLSGSDSNTLTGNTASLNRDDGITLYKSSGNILTGNTASNNRTGISLNENNGNTLTGNTASSNSKYGIFLFNSGDNILTGNTSSSNSYYGIWLNFNGRGTATADNLIYNNNFISNVNQVYSCDPAYCYGNIFNLDAPDGGNYWSDWTTPDLDGDRFVDYPYDFPNNVDYLPWTTPNGWLDHAPVADAGENILITGADQKYTVIQGTAVDPDGDPLMYRWLRGTETLLDWSSAGVNGEAYLDLADLPYLEIGNHTLTLEISDGSNTSMNDMLLTIENSPPEVQPAPSHQVAEIGVDYITIIADVADFDGDEITYECLKGIEVLDAGTVQTVWGGETVQIPDVVIAAGGDTGLPLGTHTIEMKVSDSVNNPVSSFVSVDVIDTSAPSLSPLPSDAMLWPPNHTLRSVTVLANAFDNGGGPVHLDVSVSSSELPETDGDGNTIPDYYIDSVNDETGVIELRLRSERSGKGDGRTYTINITATDESGNMSEAFTEIRAPHDRRKK